MTQDELMLLSLLELLNTADDRDQMAKLLQVYLGEVGPLSEEAAAKARELLNLPRRD